MEETLLFIRNSYKLLKENIPGGNIVIRYIQNSYQNDPFRIVLELFLVIFAFKYLVSKKYAPDTQELSLSEKEVDELIVEWKPEPLVPELKSNTRKQLDSIPVIDGPVGPYVKLLDGKMYLNLASFDFLGMAGLDKVQKSAVEAVRKYGVGACGPPGFYGTLELEKALAKFIGVQEAIIYSQAFAAVSSVIPAFSKRGDILVWYVRSLCENYLSDENINFALQKGVQISRSSVKYFKHNDMDDLERILIDVVKNAGKKIVRRFIVIEGIYQKSGDLVPLDRIIQLKEKYKFRLIADETISFGTLGKRGAGITDHFSVKPSEVDIIVGSMATSLGSSGGFCAGSHEMVDHQRLSGVAYCFSAALPALLAKASLVALEELEKRPEILQKLTQNIRAFGKLQSDDSWTIYQYEQSPIVLICQKSDNETSEHILHQVIREAAKKSLLLTKAAFVESQELNPGKPMIRIAISASHDPKDMAKASKTILNILDSCSKQSETAK